MAQCSHNRHASQDAPALCCDKDECKQCGRAHVIHVSLSVTWSEPNVAAEVRKIGG